ncbi:peptidylprolyl isomerase [Bacteroides sp. 214]|nr:peptidylprolyl isomerase [Bacteroides sp. 214]
MRINEKPIMRSEFVYAYTKSVDAIGQNENGLNRFVDLFINYKLKVAEAETMGLDTLDSFRAELRACRNALSKKYFANKLCDGVDVQKLYDHHQRKGQTHEVLIRQVFKKMEQNISGIQQRQIEALMDSLSKVVVNNPNTDFAALVSQFSDMKEEQWVGRLDVSQTTEQIVFAMAKGEISKPFYSFDGLHVVQVLDMRLLKPFDEVERELRNSMIDCTHAQTTFVESLKNEYNYTINQSAVDELFATGTTTQTLFTLDEKVYTGSDFENFAATYPCALRLQWNHFVRKSLLDYEDKQLEKKHPDFRHLMQEYYDGILLFEITEKNVWLPALDEEQQKQYYLAHRKEYEQRRTAFDGVVVHGRHKKVKKQVKRLLKNLPQTYWEDILQSYFNADGTQQVLYKVGTFKRGDDEFVDQAIFRGSKTIAHKEYPYTVVVGNKTQLSENSSALKEQLTMDYQNQLDAEWVARLRSSSLVEINEEVLKTVNKELRN